LLRRQAAINGVLLRSQAFIEYFRVGPMLCSLSWDGFSALKFESANSSIVKSIRQRDRLNAWLRLYARDQSTPRLDEYEQERLDDERLELVHYSVEAKHQPSRLTIHSEGTRMAHEITRIIASLKTICENGRFEIKRLMRSGDKLPLPKLRAVIDRDLFHRVPSRIAAADGLEFD
jgi:hypothetical protein